MSHPTSNAYAPKRLKRISIYRLKWRELCETLRGDTRPTTIVPERLAMLIEAMHSLTRFQSVFIRENRSVREARKSMLPEHIFREACDAGILERVPKRHRPTTSACLKAVADRKDPDQGRLIYPCIRLNEMCHPPDQTPLPRVPELIHGVLQQEWAWTCDLRSWFYHFEVSSDVAAKYFTTRDRRGHRYAHVRAAMGWSWMPTIACSTALFLLEQCLSDSDYGKVWIDDVVCASATKEDAEQSRQKFVRICEQYGVELRDLTPVSQRIDAVGVELNLKRKCWRLQREWIRKMADRWERLDTKRTVQADRLWSMAGNTVWGAYAGGMVMTPFLDAIRYACRHGEKWRKLGKPTRLVPLPRRVRDQLRTAAAEICSNAWRSFAPPPSSYANAIVTDASGNGLGALYPSGDDTIIRSWTLAETEHINILEIRAVTAAIRCVRPGSYWIVTDNQGVYHNLKSGLGAAALLPALNELHEAARSGRVHLFPLWLDTETMAEIGADRPSRRAENEERTVTGRDRLRSCVRRALKETDGIASKRKLTPTPSPAMFRLGRCTSRAEWLEVRDTAIRS